MYKPLPHWLYFPSQCLKHYGHSVHIQFPSKSCIYHHSPSILSSSVAIHKPFPDWLYSSSHYQELWAFSLFTIIYIFTIISLLPNIHLSFSILPWQFTSFLLIGCISLHSVYEGLRGFISHPVPFKVPYSQTFPYIVFFRGLYSQTFA